MSTEQALEVRVKFARPGGFSLDVALTVKPGITVLFGPSGAGKSTILAAIAGLTRPDAGHIACGPEIWFDDEKRIDRPVHKRGVAFVFQSLALFPHMTALANVGYGIDRRFADRAVRKRRALEMLERMRVSHLAERRPASFSGGEAQRVALARAFAMSPRVVLLDEAFSAMDRELRRDLLGDVRGYIAEARLPAIQITHHRMEARAMADHVVLLEAGRVKAAGNVDALLPEGSASGAADGRFAELDRTPIPRLVGR
jgi:molybdate transport system ATP-binding protein